MKKFKFKSFRKKSGKLTAFSLRKNFPIRVKRIFIINGEKNFVRGDHAHKKCSQFVYSILGRIKIDLVSKKDKKRVLTSYEFLFEISSIKEELNKELLTNVKKSAMDWSLNYPKGKDLEWKVKKPGQKEYILTNIMPYKQDSSKVKHNASNVKVIDKYGKSTLEEFF